jgi:hypothetical protein
MNYLLDKSIIVLMTLRFRFLRRNCMSWNHLTLAIFQFQLSIIVFCITNANSRARIHFLCTSRRIFFDTCIGTWSFNSLTVNISDFVLIIPGCIRNHRHWAAISPQLISRNGGQFVSVSDSESLMINGVKSVPP